MVELVVDNSVDKPVDNSAKTLDCSIKAASENYNRFLMAQAQAEDKLDSLLDDVACFIKREMCGDGEQACLASESCDKCFCTEVAHTLSNVAIRMARGESIHDAIYQLDILRQTGKPDYGSKT